MTEPLGLFLPAVRAWFRAHYPTPTPPQELGWPAIQRGEHTLILSPTGSGKTMAAFLWGIDSIFRALIADPELDGVQLLYVSPLKALNNDIERNLRGPLAGIRKTAHEAGEELPPMRVAVRTGDTPTALRQRMVTQPPHILITTPESLYLILTSPRACEMLRRVRTVIVDEIHTLCGNKRGVHLMLSLERLGALAGHPVQRIGLSATQRPLDEVARFLVGQEWVEDDGDAPTPGTPVLVSRPVTIVDAGAHKELDLKVITAVPDLRRLPGNSIWPALIPQVLNDVRHHRTTLIFTNSRRAAERAADRLNEQYALEQSEEVEPGSSAALQRDGVAVAQGMFGTGRVGGPFRAHHGSVSKEVRLELEQQLKAGELPALIGTSSLELGIDIGSVDAVVQLQSPRGVARGLQRVGRSGHLVGQTSVGRIYATFREDVLDAGAVAHGMLHGDIEPTYTPQNCLDILSQQIVAMVGMEPWDADRLYRLVCQAYGYQKLTPEAFRAVLGMLSGQHPTRAYAELRPRIAWDRVHDRLNPLPGTRLMALNNGGTIPDRGLFRVLLPDGKTTLGTLDEEFVYETRPGDVFTLGGDTWRALDIAEDKIIVAEAAGAMPRMPFWKGEAPKRDYHMGLRLGAFRRLLAERVAQLPPLPDDAAAPWPAEVAPVMQWLAEEYAMDEPSARNAILYVRQQLDAMGAISSDKTVIVELFSDAIGDQRMAIHSCFGGRVNSAWALALSNAFRQQYRVQVETQVNDDGILFRFLEAEREPPIELVRALGPDEARERLLMELPNSALFGAQFRMNAARALMLPRVRGAGRRTPFWLQRLRAKDLLAVAKGLDDFPLIAETYRDCLRDVLDLEHLLEVLGGVQAGEIRLVEAETLVPSPVAGSLLFDFISIQMYEGDLPKLERQMQALVLNRELLGQLLDEGSLPDLLRPEAIADVEGALQHLCDLYRARTEDELAVLLHELGDLSAEEVAARTAEGGRGWLLRLAAEGRALQVELPTRAGSVLRWIAAEDYRRYRDAFALPEEPPVPLPDDLLEPHVAPEEARQSLLRNLLRTRGPLTRDAILERYAFPLPWLEEALSRAVELGQVAHGRLSPGATRAEWCDRGVLERIHRHTLSLLRKEIRPVSLAAYAGFLQCWQGLYPGHGRHGAEGLTTVLQQMRGYPAPAVVWERDLFLARLPDFRPSRLDDLCSAGQVVWVARGEGDARRARVRFFFRGEGALWLDPEPTTEESLGQVARDIWAFLKREGACHAADLQRTLNLSAGDLDAALVELVLAGIVTNDHLSALRQVVSGEVGQAETSRGITSSLDADLAAWRAARGPSTLHRPSPLRLREARRKVAQQQPPPGSRWSGRWSLVHRIGVWGQDVSAEERGLRQARQLLLRYGIVTRECLQNEDPAWDWATLYRHYQTLELRGEVRRGYLVSGLSGAQFALPEAVERLRASNAEEAEGDDALIVLNACDPANLIGVGGWEAGGGEENHLPSPELGRGAGGEDVPPRFARLPSNYLVAQRGVPILLYEHGSHAWTALPDVDEGRVRQAVERLRAHLTRDGGLCTRPRRVLVARWNGAPPIGSPIQPLLESLGFRREPPAMVWDGGM